MAARCAKQMAQDMEAYSVVIDPVKEFRLPRFDRDEMVLDNLLGSGGFNDVYALHSIDLKRNLDQMSSCLRDVMDQVQKDEGLEHLAQVPGAHEAGDGAVRGATGAVGDGAGGGGGCRHQENLGGVELMPVA